MKKDLSVEKLIAHGFDELTKNRAHNALIDADQGLIIEPHNVDLLLLKSEIALSENDAESALFWIEKGLSLEPYHPGLSLQKATLLFDHYEDFFAAKEILIGLQEDLEQLPKNELLLHGAVNLLMDVYLLLIDCLRMERRFACALELAVKTKMLVPEESAAMLALATAHFEVGEYKKSLSLLFIESGEEDADFFWIKALLYCAMGDFEKSEEQFNKAYKLDKTRYHRPVRLDKNEFNLSYNQALLSLPKDIRDYVSSLPIKIVEIIPSELVKSSVEISPTACVARDETANVIIIAQKNVENVAINRSQIKDIIASSLIHELSGNY